MNRFERRRQPSVNSDGIEASRLRSDFIQTSPYVSLGVSSKSTGIQERLIYLKRKTKWSELITYVRINCLSLFDLNMHSSELDQSKWKQTSNTPLPATWTTSGNNQQNHVKLKWNQVLEGKNDLKTMRNAVKVKVCKVDPIGILQIQVPVLTFLFWNVSGKKWTKTLQKGQEYFQTIVASSPTLASDQGYCCPNLRDNIRREPSHHTSRFIPRSPIRGLIDHEKTKRKGVAAKHRHLWAPALDQADNRTR